MSATDLAIGILVKMADKGRFFNLQSTEDDFADAVELVKAFHEAYKAGRIMGASDAIEASLAEAESECRVIAVEVESALRRPVPDPVASILRVLTMHDIVPGRQLERAGA